MFYPKYVAGELGFAHFKLIMCYCSSIWNIPQGRLIFPFLFIALCVCAPSPLLVLPSSLQPSPSLFLILLYLFLSHVINLTIGYKHNSTPLT